MKPLLIVSDDSARKAAATIAGQVYDVITYKQATPTAVKGHAVLLWPNAPGEDAAKRANLIAKTASQVKAILTQGQPDGWNATQALKDGWDYKRLVAWAGPRAVPITYIEVAVTSDDTPKPTQSQYAEIEKLGLALSNGKPIGDVSNICRFLERSDYVNRVWFDDFYHCLYVTLPDEPLHEWSDFDTLKLTDHLQQNLGIRKISKDVVSDAVELHGRRNPRNAPREWLDSLHWDNKFRIGSFFSDFMGAESSPYTNAVGHNFWVSMVARVYRPGCQMDHMVVLEGPQNAGKTSALRIIGGDWYAEASESVQSKDFFMILKGRILVEIAELDAFSRAEVNRIKQVISCPVDSYRAPYARREADYPRTAIFAGTTNDDSYLRDATGGRRFWPMKCGQIDLDGIKKWREQLFAEAVECFKDGAPWHLTPDQDTKEMQESRRERDAWEDLLGAELVVKDKLTLADAAGIVKVTVDKLDMRTQKRLGICLRKLGFIKKVLRNQGVNQKIWCKIGGVADLMGSSEVAEITV